MDRGFLLAAWRKDFRPLGSRTTRVCAPTIRHPAIIAMVFSLDSAQAGQYTGLR